MPARRSRTTSASAAIGAVSARIEISVALPEFGGSNRRISKAAGEDGGFGPEHRGQTLGDAGNATSRR